MVVPADNFIVRKLIVRGHKPSPSVGMRRPITHAILSAMCHALTVMSHYYVKLYQALYLTAYFGLFRIWELIPAARNSSVHVVQLYDLSIQQNETVNTTLIVVLKNSKYLKNHKPVQVRIDSQTTPLCVVQAI